MENKKEVVLHLLHNPLADATQGTDCFSIGIGYRRVNAAEKKRTGKANFLQRHSDDARF